MTIGSRRNGDTLEVMLSESLTFSDHAMFREILSEIKTSKITVFILELSNLNWINSAGLGMLLLARDAAHNAGAELILRSPKGHVKELLELGCFDKLLKVEP